MPRFARLTIRGLAERMAADLVGEAIEHEAINVEEKTGISALAQEKAANS